MMRRLDLAAERRVNEVLGEDQACISPVLLMLETWADRSSTREAAWQSSRVRSAVRIIPEQRGSGSASGRRRRVSWSGGWLIAGRDRG